MTVPYTRRFAPGDFGTDVEAVGRALCRAGAGPKLAVYNALPTRVRRRWGWRKRRWLRAFKRTHNLADDAVYGKGAHAALEPFFDPWARELVRRYTPPIKLVEPRQGWGSLDRSLWELYAIAVGKYGMTDLGTYNPASRLPSGGISDHAKGPPALAFDVGIDPDIGMADPEGRAFFNLCSSDRRVEYVILGDRIGSFKFGSKPYGSGGHLNHAHVSARHSRIARAAFRLKDLAEQAAA